MLNSLDSVRIFSFQGRAVLRDAGQILGSKGKKKEKKKKPSLPLICASVRHAR